MKREKLEEIIKAAIVSQRAETVEQREQIYQAARASLANRSAQDPAVAEMLDSVITEIEASFAPPEPKKRSLPRAFLLGLLIGAVVAGGATVAFLRLPGASSAQTVQAQFDKPFEAGAKQLPIAEAYLRMVMDAVFKRPKNDAAFRKSEKRLIPLKDFDPDLAKQMPTGLPPGSAVTIRADGNDVKLLMSWQLCGVAQILKPELVDPRRSGANMIGCPNFGVWTEGAANW